MSVAEWLVDRFKVIRGSLDGSADKLWRFYKGRIKELEEQLAEARADRDMFRRSRDGWESHARNLDQLLVEEQQAHKQTHARLVRAAKRCVKLRDECDSLREHLDAVGSSWTAPYRQQ